MSKSNLSTTKQSFQKDKITPIDCKVSNGMTRIYGIRKEKRELSDREFDALLKQMPNNE